VLYEVVVAIAEREREGQKFHVFALDPFCFFFSFKYVCGGRNERGEIGHQVLYCCLTDSVYSPCFFWSAKSSS